MKPGKEPTEIVIRNDLKLFQQLVGGWIETVTIDNIVVICNEDGRIYGLPHCATIAGIDFVGDLVIVGVKGENFADCPITVEKFKQRYLGGE